MNSFDFNKRLRKARDLMQTANHAEALRAYAELVRKYPAGGVAGEYARAAAIYGDFDLADQLWVKIRSSERNTADLLSRLAWEYQQIRLHARARELYRLAAEAEPGNLEAQLSLAWLLARTNSTQDARPTVNKCLELSPRHEQARYLSAHLDCREDKLAEAERQFRDLLASELQDPYVQYSCRSELATIYDRTGRFDEAMAELFAGKALLRPSQEEADRRRTDASYDDMLRQVRALPKNILEMWGQSFPPRDRKPIVSLAVLMGAARSGTTLLERVLDAHSLLGAADESLALTKIMPLVDITARAFPSQRLGVLRQRYLGMLAKTSGPAAPGKVLLDKNPSQTIWLAAFLRLFPEVRVITALRDPRDIVMSLYFQNQTLTNYQTPEMLAQYYVKIMDLWLAVREWSGFSWIETRYEDVVADLSKEGARVTEFLGLEWKQDQADFHRSNHDKPLMSTNYSAVTQPLYTRAVGRWRSYEKYVAPVLPILEPYCKAFGYR